MMVKIKDTSEEKLSKDDKQKQQDCFVDKHEEQVRIGIENNETEERSRAESIQRLGDAQKKGDDTQLAIPEQKTNMFSFISVEPLLLLEIMAMTFSNILGQDLFLYKYCRYTFNYSEDICTNLTAYNDIEDEVYKRTATLNMFRDIVESSFPILFALFLGPWSDKYGRKIPMLLGMAANFVQSFGLLINAIFIEWPPELVLVLSAFPYSLLGGHLPFVSCLYAYITDNSSRQARFLRLTFLGSFRYMGVSAGSYLGGYIAEVAGFTWTFFTAVMISSAGFLYCFFLVKEPKRPNPDPSKNKCLAFFDLRHVKQSFIVCLKKRDGYRKMFILLLCTSLLLSTTATNGERTVEYLFLQEQFDWGAQEYALLQAYNSITALIVLTIVSGILNRLLCLSDAVICLLATTMGIAAKMTWAFSTEGWMYYLGATADCMQAVMPSGIRAMVSKTASSAETGQVYAALAALESVVPLYASVAYRSFFNATLSALAGAFFLMSAGLEFCSLCSLSTIYLLSRKTGLYSNERKKTKKKIDEEEQKENSET